MIDKLIQLLPEGYQLILSSDREYGCKTVLKGLGVDFIVPILLNAALYSVDFKQPARGRRLKGHKLLCPAQLKRSCFKMKKLTLYGKTIRALVTSFECYVIVWGTESLIPAG